MTRCTTTARHAGYVKRQLTARLRRELGEDASFQVGIRGRSPKGFYVFTRGISKAQAPSSYYGVKVVRTRQNVPTNIRAQRS